MPAVPIGAFTSAEFSAAQNRVVFRLGSGATAIAGGELIPNATFTVRFRVRVNPAAAA